MRGPRPATIAAIALFAVTGCRDPDGGSVFDTADDLVREVFPQAEPATADILWVVDSSCSMEDEQNALAANFPSFIEVFLERGLEFQIAVTSTNIDEDGTDGLDGRMAGDPPIITSEDDDPEAMFIERSLVGIDQGHQDEKGLEAAWQAIEVLGDGPNAGFLREEAHLAVIIVSDEPDFSEREQSDGEDLMHWQEFADWMNALKGPTGLRYSDLSAIVGVSDDGFVAPGWCGIPDGEEPGQGEGAQRGDGYLEAAVATGGLWASICEEDWGELLGRVGLRAAGLMDSWQLEWEPAPGTLEVRVNGNTPPPDSWEYFALDNSIRFLTVASIPRPGSVVEVQYEKLEAPEGE